MLNCKYCSYSSYRNFCVKRHEINKHSKEILRESGAKYYQQQINSQVSNIQYMHKETQTEDIDFQYENQFFKCSKCYKEYITNENLKNHEEKCLGLDILTCPKCMISFSSSGNKSKHIKRNNCIAKSIIYTKNDKNIIINNYGKERLDYLSISEIVKIIMKVEHSIYLLIEKKHFNKDFPENHNIIYDDKTKKYKIKENDMWKIMNIKCIISKLINDNADYLLKYYNDNRHLIDNEIKNDEFFDFFRQQLLIIKYKNDKNIYRNISDDIKIYIENML